MIIDFHTHVDEAGALGWIDPPNKLVPLLDDAGIDIAVIMTYVDLPGPDPHAFEYIAKAVDAYPGRFTGFVRLNPNYQEAGKVLEQAALDPGFRGVKLHPTTTLAHPAGEATVELMRRCGELNMPILFHCGDDPYTTPQAIGLGARKAPESTIILGHMGGYFHVEDAIAEAERLPNLMLETSAMPFPRKIAEAVDRLGAGRILFGSDGPGCNPGLEVQKVRLAGLRADDEARVLGQNAARLLQLDGTDAR